MLIVISDGDRRPSVLFFPAMSSTAVNEPAPTERPSTASAISQRVSRFTHKVSTRHGWVGDYDYAWLCTPSLPFMRRKHNSPPFYALDSELPLLVSITCGLQHSLAMLAGLITPPIIFASALSLDSEMSAYMISASLIGCGVSRLLFLYILLICTQEF